jgi:hypothetical protein
MEKRRQMDCRTYFCRKKRELVLDRAFVDLMLAYSQLPARAKSWISLMRNNTKLGKRNQSVQKAR